MIQTLKMLYVRSTYTRAHVLYMMSQQQKSSAFKEQSSGYLTLRNISAASMSLRVIMFLHAVVLLCMYIKCDFATVLRDTNLISKGGHILELCLVHTRTHEEPALSKNIKSLPPRLNRHDRPKYSLS